MSVFTDSRTKKYMDCVEAGVTGYCVPQLPKNIQLKLKELKSKELKSKEPNRQGREEGRKGGNKMNSSDPFRQQLFKNLVKRFIHVAKKLKPELKVDCSVAFVKLFVTLFQEIPQTRMDLLLGEQSLTTGDVMDLLFLIAGNTEVPNRDTYAAMYWATQLLHVTDESGSRRLQHSLEVQGFVFSDNADQAVAQMRTHCRKPPIWDRVRNSVEQLCVALNMPPAEAIAGIYNDVVSKCCLPERQLFTATRSDLRRLISHYFTKPLYRPDIQKYVDTYMGGNRVHNVTINGDTSSVAIRLEDKKTTGSLKTGGERGGNACNTGKPFFSGQQACVEALILAMADLAPLGYPEHAWKWFVDRYKVQKKAGAEAEETEVGIGEREAESYGSYGSERRSGSGSGKGE